VGPLRWVFLYTTFFFVSLGLSNVSWAQTGNNWKIMIQEPFKDQYWSTVGSTKSITPRFPGSKIDPATHGSCVIIEPDLVLTVAHAVRNSNMEITIAGAPIKSNLIAIDLYNDRALLRLEAKYSGPIRKLRESPLRQNEKFKSYGFGRAYGYHNIEFKDKLFYGDAYFGDSGGPILDESGDVVGIICATSKDEVAKTNNIFSYGYETLYKWVQDNKGGDISSPVITRGK